MSQPAFPFHRQWPERSPMEGHDVLFDTPDRLLTLLLISPDAMVQGYRQLLDHDALAQAVLAPGARPAAGDRAPEWGLDPGDAQQQP